MEGKKSLRLDHNTLPAVFNNISLSENLLHKLNNLSIKQYKGYPVEIGIFREFHSVYKIIRTERLSHNGKKTFREMDVFMINEKDIDYKPRSQKEINFMKNPANWTFIYSFKVEDFICYTGEIYL